MVIFWRWLFNTTGNRGTGTSAVPNDDVFSRQFVSSQHGMSTGVDWYEASFSNDAFDFWVTAKWANEPNEKWVCVMAAEDFRKLALWYLWRWAWGEWFGLRRWLWYAALKHIYPRVEVNE